LGVASSFDFTAEIGGTRLRGVGSRNLDLVVLVADDALAAAVEGVANNVLDTGGGARNLRPTGVLLVVDPAEATPLPVSGVGGLGLCVALYLTFGDAGGVAAWKEVDVGGGRLAAALSIVCSEGTGGANRAAALAEGGAGVCGEIAAACS
jgi:hypothetical protein